MIRKRYEMEVDGKVVLRFRPKQDTVKMQYDSARYGNYTHVILSREHILELRDCLDEIMRDWFCDKEPSPMELYKKCLNPKTKDSTVWCNDNIPCTHCGTVAPGPRIRDNDKFSCSPCYHGEKQGMDATTFIPCEVRDYKAPEDTIEALRRNT
jgi:hypothetical protein